MDDAFGFMAGWNFFVRYPNISTNNKLILDVKFYEALLVPFEITALCSVINWWRDDIPKAAVITATIVLYA